MTTKTVEPFRVDSVTHVLSESDLSEFLTLLHRYKGPVILDLETTDLNEHWRYARIVTFAATLPSLDEDGQETEYPQTYVVGLSHPDSPLHTQWRSAMHDIAYVLKSRQHPIIGQNIRFDVRWITALTGVDLTEQIVADTGLGFHLIDENQTASLKPRCMKEFGIDSWIDFDWGVLRREQVRQKGYPNVPLLAERVDYFTMAMYNARDTYWTWRAHQMQSRHLGLTRTDYDNLIEEGDPDSIRSVRLGSYYRRLSVPAVRTLTALEQRGMMLDQDWCRNRLVELQEISEKAIVEMEDLLDRCRDSRGLTEEQEEALSGEQSFQPTAKWFLTWTEVMCDNNLMQVINRTKEGRPAWGKSVLKRLSRLGFEAAVPLMEFRRSDKEAQYIRSWLDSLSADGKLHATYNYYKVVTGRLSSENPNAQQIPRGAKNAFIASPGTVLITADYSQIELRIAAHMAGCEPMLDAFRDGKDLHALMASMVAGCDISEVTKTQRQMAKAVNFGFVFGMGAPGFVDYAADSYDVEFTLEEAEEFRKAFFDVWVGMAEWHRSQKQFASAHGYVKSPLGRVRNLPDVWSDWSGYRNKALRQAINSPVQGMASDLTLIAADVIRHDFPDIHPVALVHDCVLSEAPADRAAEAAAQVKHAMEQSVLGRLEKLGVHLSVPLVADVAWGHSWGSCESA